MNFFDHMLFVQSQSRVYSLQPLGASRLLCPTLSLGKRKSSLLSHVQLFTTLWTVACQALLSMEFSRQEYWNGLPFPSPETFPTQELNPDLLHCKQILYWAIWEAHYLLEFAQIHESVILSNHLILCHPFSFCLQSFPASGSFLMTQLFTLSGQSIEASVSVLPMSIQGWFPLGVTGFISMQSKGLSRVFSNTVILKHQLLALSLLSSFSGPRFVWTLH